MSPDARACVASAGDSGAALGYIFSRRQTLAERERERPVSCIALPQVADELLYNRPGNRPAASASLHSARHNGPEDVASWTAGCLGFLFREIWRFDVIDALKEWKGEYREDGIFGRFCADMMNLNWVKLVRCEISK